MNFIKRAAPIVLTAIIAVCLGLIIYFALLPAPGDSFSEFYILNENGKPYDYPGQVTPDQPLSVTVGIVNHEAGPASYTVRILSGGDIIRSLDTGTVNRGQKWEGKADITITTAGSGRQVEFYLYMDGEQTPHIKQPLVLTVDVRSY